MTKVGIRWGVIILNITIIWWCSWKQPQSLENPTIKGSHRGQERTRLGSTHQDPLGTLCNNPFPVGDYGEKRISRQTLSLVTIKFSKYCRFCGVLNISAMYHRVLFDFMRWLYHMKYRESVVLRPWKRDKSWIYSSIEQHIAPWTGLSTRL